ncbi:hypothetical protein LR48_Vigan04g107200 [Vigna angularis]|uniref:Uncharacterized protein n=2 Tax=Phaseolus angularis TaxID=3914 RepID=A0A0L9UEA4_PHAAN|nr:uncharacterized protein LOC108331448 isoform X1 [Vigna angularis]KAG2399495.1 uncharacterized protein HKW66_Vig0080230 [Vigna angularis]KOM40874.1 hypothetical protein LR48_Vigan04g107200 [Vigna angularis]BAT79118.1 hypothetical protein VIGAN_02193800 [Vigna angularis var. angularis]
MLGFGEEELTTESNAIPCLIFTQLLVLLLLFVLLFFFVVFPLDPADNLITAGTTSPSTSSNFFLFDAIRQIELPQPVHDSSPSHSTTTPQYRLLQGGENVVIKGEIKRGGSMRVEEEIVEEGDSSSSSLYFQPCHYLQLASVAFLKCFGLDSSSDTPSTKSRKRKQS